MELLHMTIGALLRDTARRFPDAPALLSPDGDSPVTWRELDCTCDSLAKGLLKLGLGRGDRLAVRARNRREWVEIFLAAVRIGLVAVPLNTGLLPGELKVLLDVVQPAALVFAGDDDDAVTQAIREERLPGMPAILLDATGSGEGTLAEVKALGAVADNQAQLVQAMERTTAEDVAVIMFTSGSTGEPKGVMLRHLSVVNNALDAGRILQMGPEDRLCLPVPFFHCFGLTMGILLCVGTGAALAPLRRFRSADTLRMVKQYRCTLLHGVPTMFQRLLTQEGFDSADMCSLRSGIIAGAPVDGNLIDEIMTNMHMSGVVVSFGLTESSPACTMTLPDDAPEIRRRSIGRPLPHVEMRVCHPCTGIPCAAGECGELQTRGYHVMKGYWGRPDLTAETVDSDGWLHTGDLGLVDEEGRYHFIDRLKDIIIRGGENVSAQEVENAIRECDDVEDACVMGIPDKYYGEEVAAMVWLREDSFLTEEQLRAFLSTRLARYKIPKFLYFCGECPLLENGKVKRSAVREKLLNLINRLRRGAGTVH